jgi:predicted nucleic acid-binding protein
MAASVVVDASFLVALLERRDRHHAWAVAEAARHARPWQTCESALSEAFFLLDASSHFGLVTLLRRGAVEATFRLGEQVEAVLALMHKYADVPMSLADGCLVRMTEVLRDPVLLTTDADFRIYRRNGRQIVPYVSPN